MSVDYPRGWQICDASKDEDHHARCSWRTHKMLCDCDVLMRHPEQLDKTALYGKDGKVLHYKDANE